MLFILLCTSQVVAQGTGEFFKRVEGTLKSKAPTGTLDRKDFSGQDVLFGIKQGDGLILVRVWVFPSSSEADENFRKFKAVSKSPLNESADVGLSNLDEKTQAFLSKEKNGTFTVMVKREAVLFISNAASADVAKRFAQFVVDELPAAGRLSNAARP